jgi:hypothetical protein
MLEIDELQMLQKNSSINLQNIFNAATVQALKNVKAKIRGNVRTRRGRISKSSLDLPEEYRLPQDDEKTKEND